MHTNSIKGWHKPPVPRVQMPVSQGYVVSRKTDTNSAIDIRHNDLSVMDKTVCITSGKTNQISILNELPAHKSLCRIIIYRDAETVRRHSAAFVRQDTITIRVICVNSGCLRSQIADFF